MHFDESFQVNREVLCAVMSTIHYFDIFKHPLRENEILELSHHHAISPHDLTSALFYLTEQSILQEHNGYYLPHRNFDNITRRINGLRLSEKYWKKAHRKSKLISKFPFTRCVLISGSLSKGYMDDQSDIDYLIITKPGRLWIARTMLVLYKKIFLLNSHKFFCVNYFLDQNNLVLNDRNLFTATELLFAKPVYNPEIFDGMLQANPWAKEYYPSFLQNQESFTKQNINTSKIKSLLEKLLNGKTGDSLDQWCMKLFNSFKQRKFSDMPKEQYRRDMKSGKGVSKHHPNGFRDKILNEHIQRMELFLGQLSLHSAEKATQTQPVYQS